jgi:hypothetical protein
MKSIYAAIGGNLPALRKGRYYLSPTAGFHEAFANKAKQVIPCQSSGFQYIKGRQT